ncbi:MAG: NAD-dependent epimerase/dehydratase family protein [Alistipes sp.]|nr:NAD-dependent epimerase/dehydratase family protein [Alistipes sp.]
MKILVTGIAGFIGYHLALRLAKEGVEVVGVDSLNDYYSVALKYGRLSELGLPMSTLFEGIRYRSLKYPNLAFYRLSVENRHALPALFERESFDCVVHLAAQAGVRYSLENPFAYVDSNISGMVNMLECCRHFAIKHLLYASSSSVYGDNPKVPFSEGDVVEAPVSLYAATKRSDELMAQVYARLFQLPSTGLRLFTVYGPWGRPDMSPMLFADAICNGRPIRLFNHGDMMRDFTYIDDVVEGVVRLIGQVPSGDVPCEIFNIGRGKPTSIMNFIAELERVLGCRARFEMLPMQAGDVPCTYADTSKLKSRVGFAPQTPLRKGVESFVQWYRSECNPLK